MKLNYFIIIFSLLMFFTCKEEKRAMYDIAILNGNVIDVESGTILKQDVLIKDNRIKGVIASGTSTNYEVFETIDASDKYILPGFWDNHVHFRGGDALIMANKTFLKLFIMNGVTTVRDAGGDLTPSVIKWNKEVKSGELLGPNIFTSGPKIDGPEATWAGSLEVENNEDISRALDSLQKLKTDFVKIYDSRITREAYLETVEQATSRGLVTSGHIPFTVELKETIEAGIGAIEHLYYILKGCSSKEQEITKAIVNKEYGFWQSMDQLISSYDDEVAQRTFQNLKDNDVYVVPTLHIGDILSYLDQVDHRDNAYLKMIPKEIVKTYEGRIKGALNASDKSKENRMALNSKFIELTKSLNKAKVKLLAGSDCGAFNSYVYPGISLHKELQEMVEAGLTPREALKTSSLNGSDFLNKNRNYGTIEKGKIADIVILNASPLEDISQTRNIYRVIKNHQIINPKDIAQEIGCIDCLY